MFSWRGRPLGDADRELGEGEWLQRAAGKVENVTHIDGRTTQGAGAVQVEVAAETI